MSDRLFDRAMRDWLESGSDRTPPAAVEAVLLAVKTTPQERVLRIPRRFSPMTTYTRLAAAIAIVAVLGVGALAYLGRSPGFGSATQPPPNPTASPTPSPAPTAVPSPTLGPLDTSDWVPFTSTRYGFTIKHPVDWTEQKADHDWTFEKDIKSWTSTAPESFFIPTGGGVKVSAWSVSVTPGTTPESWLQSFCDATNPDPCADLQTVAVESGDGRPGVFTQATDGVAAFLVDQTMYVVAIWRTEDDPSVLAYGGARRLLEGYISTLTITAGASRGSPSPS